MESQLIHLNSQVSVSNPNVDSRFHTGLGRFLSFAGNDIVWVEITQLLLVLLHFEFPKVDLFGSFCHLSVRSWSAGQSSCKPPAEAAGSHVVVPRAVRWDHGEGSFHSDHE